jgi:hypothetical protein
VFKNQTSYVYCKARELEHLKTNKLSKELKITNLCVVSLKYTGVSEMRTASIIRAIGPIFQKALIFIFSAVRN